MSDSLMQVCERLAQNGFRASCAQDRNQAREQIVEIVAKGSSVGIGDSVTVRQTGAIEALEEAGCTIVDLFSKTISELTKSGDVSMQQRARIARATLRCEYYLTGSNAVTRTGALVNIDGYGNRVAGMICGPENAILVIGRNKIVDTVDDAIHALRNVITPELARMKWKATPCAESGKCSDCSSPERLCSITTILERAPGYMTSYVILVDEDLGLGWSVDWPEDRISAIRSSADSYTWLKLGTRRPRTV